MPSPTNGYFNATTAATAKPHSVESDRIRMILRTLGAIVVPGVRSIRSQINAT